MSTKHKFMLLLASTLLSAASFAQDPPAAASVELFTKNCSMCHGTDGAGSDIGKSLKVKDLRSKEVQDMTDDQIKTTVTKGNGNMPPFGTTFNDDQLNQLISVIRSFKPKS